MKNTRVVNLGGVRDLLSEWEKVRAAIISGDLDRFQCTLGSGDRETIYLGGIYKDQPKLALGAILKTSMARVLMEDTPPSLKTAT